MDDFSQKYFILKNKVKYFSKFKEFKAFIEKQIGGRIKTLKIDNGRELSQENSKKFEFSKHSLLTSTPYILKQNKVAYRLNHTIVEVAQYIPEPRFKVLGIRYHYCNLPQSMIPTHKIRDNLKNFGMGENQ
jgi:hypothetical protein